MRDAPFKTAKLRTAASTEEQQNQNTVLQLLHRPYLLQFLHVTDAGRVKRLPNDNNHPISRQELGEIVCEAEFRLNRMLVETSKMCCEGAAGS